MVFTPYRGRFSREAFTQLHQSNTSPPTLHFPISLPLTSLDQPRPNSWCLTKEQCFCINKLRPSLMRTQSHHKDQTISRQIAPPVIGKNHSLLENQDSINRRINFIRRPILWSNKQNKGIEVVKSPNSTFRDSQNTNKIHKVVQSTIARRTLTDSPKQGAQINDNKTQRRVKTENLYNNHKVVQSKIARRTHWQPKTRCAIDDK